MTGPKLIVSVGCVLTAAAMSMGQGVSVHPSHRYYQDAAGNPVFLIGYYGWAAVPAGYYIDHPAQYSAMITQGAPYEINYIRISLGVNRFTGSSNPPSWDGRPTPVPFAYVNGKADLDQWDPVFWDGLRAQCSLARQNGVFVHVSIFDGVEIRPCSEAYRWGNSFWNVNNQVRSFYGNLDTNGNCGAEENGEFYRLNDFSNNTGVGYYQRRLIDKVIAETAAFDNVFFETGNELLSSPADWNTALIAYVRARTTKPVSGCEGGRASNLQGWAQHEANTPAEVKSNVAVIVGMGYPAWEDPDGPALSDAGVSPDDLRRAAWYSFVGGAAGWGGFTVDFWAGGSGLNTTKVTYYRNLQTFIQVSGVKFWDMVPQQGLVGNSGENSCLARSGSEYLVYVLNDASATLNLGGAAGTAYCRTYDPKTGVFGAQSAVAAGGTVTLNKPAGADDWVVHVTATAASNWDTLGPEQMVAGGQMPAIASDSLGNIHVIYLFGNSIQYRKYDDLMNPLATETVSSSAGYWPHIMCDAANVPHVIFSEAVNPDMPYARYCYYTNRAGGSWKTPILAMSMPSGEDFWYPRLGLWGSYAYIGCQYGMSGQSIGKVIRLANLSGTPTVDRSVNTQTRSCMAINSAGQVFAPGRNGAAGTYCQRYDSDLNPVGGFYNVSAGAGKTGGSQTAWADRSNVVHMITWAIEANGSFPCNDRCGMAYNNSVRRNPDGSYQNCVQGLLGPAAGAGPDGNEPSGWWNDDVAPVIVADATNTVYVAWRGWTPAGEGRIAKVDDAGFTQTCSSYPTCGGEVCTGTEFCSSITRRRWWNCEMAPARDHGVYVVWDDGGTVWLRSVGVDTPATPDCLSDAFSYPDGDLNGNGGWNGTATSQIRVVGETVKISGGTTTSDAVHSAYCPDPGTGYIKASVKIKQGVGDAVLWGLWFDDPSGNNLARWYGKGTTARGRIGGTADVTAEQTLTGGWDTLTVKINPAADTSEFLFNGIPIGTLSHSVTGASNILGRIRFEQIANLDAVGHYIYFDDLATGERPSSGDFDDDGDVDQEDFGDLQSCLGEHAIEYPSGCEACDLDDDGDVDPTDFLWFQECFAGPGRPPACSD